MVKRAWFRYGGAELLGRWRWVIDDNMELTPPPCDVPGIENSLFNGSNVGVKNSELQILKCSYGLNKLSRPSSRQNLNQSIETQYLNLHISQARLALGCLSLETLTKVEPAEAAAQMMGR
ncbi:beta-galactosidase 3 [Striga asiatica]|uniref:Beta-galactosidase 3 n=1 Tax=Striga asiatica TaxID=4170 RepID=A0A5A7R0Z7_STRAF|nr:beta-galactosidase 3 [Striga asiatica]